MKRGRIETTLPLPIIFVCILAIAAYLIRNRFAPSREMVSQWMDFHFYLILIVLLVAAPTVGWNWPLHPRCSISRRLDNKYVFGTAVSYYLYCEHPSIGKISVVGKEESDVKWEYFCKYCDPDKFYFQEVLRGRYKEAFVSSVKRFWLVEKEKTAKSGSEQSDDLDPPDIRLSQ